MELLLNGGAWLVSNMEVILSVIGVFALLATKTPNTSDDKIVQFVLNFVNFMAGNVGKAKNSE